MKVRKKLISILVVFAMCISMIPMAMAAPSYEDVDGHWAEEAIQRWSEYGVLEGSEGLFAPDQELTRGQLAAILSRLLNLKPAESAGFTDVAEDAWYADYINRCAAAGIMKGSEGMARPDDPITREETMVMMGRALNIKPAEKSELDGFHDKENVSDWAAGYVAALTSGGIVNGVGGALVPQNNIDRASTATILHRAIGAYANEAGQTVEAQGTGIVIVTAPDVTVTGFAGSVLVTPGVGEGTVTLSEATVDAGVTVTAEKATLVVTENSTAGEVVLTEAAAGSKLEVAETGAVGTVTTQAAGSAVTVSGKVESVTAAETAGEVKVEVTKTAEVTNVTTEASKAEVTVAGKVDKVETSATASDTKVEVTKDAAVGEIAAAGENTGITVSGKVDSVTVADTASNTTVEANKGSTIAKVDNAAEGTTVSGSGKVDNVTTSGDNTTISTPGTKVDVSEGTSGTTAGGKDVEGGSSTTTKPSTPSGGGGGGSTGGGDTHSHSYAAEWSKDADNHWHACACGAVSDKVAHTWNEGAVTKEATCTEKGVKTYTCSVCGATKTEEIPATGHSFADTWSYDETNHWHACACGAVADKAEHTWGEGVVTTDPTCTNEGVKTYTCTVCSETKTEPIPARHTYVDDVCSICNAIAENVKFYLGVTSGDTVDAIVTDDYTATFRLPANGTVNTNSVTLTAKMQNVESLGVNGVREHSVNITTGLGSNEVDLTYWLKNCYQFKGATIKANIGSKECTYTFDAISDYKIVATTDTVAARAAWQELTGYVTAGTQDADDSFILVKNGSTLQIGQEKLEFEKAEDLKLDNFNDLDVLNQNIRDHVKLSTATENTNKIIIVLKQGTQLAVSNSVATLNKDITITVEGINLGDDAHPLAALQQMTDMKAMVMGVVGLFDELVGVIDSSDTVTVTIQ